MFETTIEIYINKTDDNIALKRLFKTTVCLPQLFKIAKFVIKLIKVFYKFIRTFIQLSIYLKFLKSVLKYKVKQ